VRHTDNWGAHSTATIGEKHGPGIGTGLGEDSFTRGLLFWDEFWYFIWDSKDMVVNEIWVRLGEGWVWRGVGTMGVGGEQRSGEKSLHQQRPELYLNHRRKK